MNRDVLLGAGVVLAFIVLVSRAKKNQVTETTAGGGIGGGPIVGFPPAGPLTVNNIIQPATGGVQPTPVNPVISKALGSDVPVAASSSSTSAGATSGVGVTNTGGIVPVSQGGSVTPTYSTGTVSQADLAKGISGGTVFKPFSGSSIDAKFLGFVGSKPKFEFN